MNIIASARSRSINLKSNRQPFPFSRSNTAEFGSLIWEFDPDNHYLHPKLIHFIYSKKVFRGIIITLIPMFVLSLIPSLIWSIYIVLVSVFLWIPYLILVILSFNRDANGFILVSSEFWIKIVYAFAYSILLMIHYHYVWRIGTTNIMLLFLGYAVCIVGFLLVPSLLVVVGGMDAIPKMRYKSKSILMSASALFFTITAIQYQFLTPKDKDHVVIVEATGSEISVVSSLTNVTGMLAIFLWKQAIDVIRNKDRCTSITYRPYLKWIKLGSGSQLIETQQIQEFDLVAPADVVTTADADTDVDMDACIVGL